MFQAALTQETAEDGSTVVVSMQGPLCFANAQRIKERLIQFSVRASSSFDAAASWFRSEEGGDVTCF